MCYFMWRKLKDKPKFRIIVSFRVDFDSIENNQVKPISDFLISSSSELSSGNSEPSLHHGAISTFCDQIIRI